MTSTVAHVDFQIVPGESARHVAHFSQDEIIRLYEESLPVPPDMRNEFSAIDLWECEQSKLIYATPVTPGSNRFYEWITRSEENYYPTARTEWTYIGDAVSGFGPDQHVLDIGCGAGNLLDYLRTRTKATLHGLDATPTSVEACRAKGHAAHLGYLSDLIADDANRGKFSAVIMTHVLEHVPRPVQLIAEALTVLKRDGGKLLVSTPHSPTLYEAKGYHGKNLPPHHITRWRATSYRRLADRFELKVSLKPLSSSAIGLVASHFSNSIDLHSKNWRRDLALNGVRHPLMLARSAMSILSRERAEGRVIGNDILGIFSY